ncbi:hypothetical protein JTB14_004750 [Gonioctena quinquepunctata]|nr:hypothetical protein JTB14_004750 [Gonioctena quinquepunctata]
MGSFSANSNIYRPPMMAKNVDNPNIQLRDNTSSREEISPRQNNMNRETNVNRAHSSDRHTGFQRRNPNQINSNANSGNAKRDAPAAAASRPAN